MPDKNNQIVATKNKLSMIVYFIAIIAMGLSISLILLLYYYDSILKISGIVTTTTISSTTPTSTIPTDCLKNPFSISCINYCKNQSDKNKCIINICNQKYSSYTDPFMSKVLADCVNPARMIFSDLQYVFKTGYYCLNTGIAPFNNPSASPTSIDCNLAAGAFLNKKNSVIQSVCNDKYKDDYQQAYNCHLQANYQSYNTINTLVNCSNLTASKDNIFKCLYYIKMSLAYENKATDTNAFNNRVNEICRLIEDCDSPITFNLSTSTNNTKDLSTSTSKPTPRSLLLNNLVLNNSVNLLENLIGFCVEDSYPIPTFSFF